MQKALVLESVPSLFVTHSHRMRVFSLTQYFRNDEPSNTIKKFVKIYSLLTFACIDKLIGDFENRYTMTC